MYIIIAIIFIIIFSILIHEIGHICIAKLVRYRFSSFVIGSGRTLYDFTIFNTNIIVKIFPFGGRFKFTANYTPISNIACLLGGSFFNLLFSFICVFSFITFYGNFIYHSDVSNVFGWVQSKSIFDNHRVKAGSKLIGVNKIYGVSVLELMRDVYYSDNSKSYNLTIETDGEVSENTFYLGSSDVSDILPSSILSHRDSEVFSISGVRVYSYMVSLGTLFKDASIRSMYFNFSLTDGEKKTFEVFFDENGNVSNLSLKMIEGLRVCGVNGREMKSIKEILEYLKTKELSVVVKNLKNGDFETFYFEFDANKIDKTGELLNLNIDITKLMTEFYNDRVAEVGILKTFKFCLNTVKYNMKKILGGQSEALRMMHGPIGMLRDFSEIPFDIRACVYFLVLLNIQWAAINLLPLYFLDGGGIVANIITVFLGTAAQYINYLYFILSYMFLACFFMLRLVV